MADIDIRRLDFTLLLVLASLLRTRKATATATELHMTQSTVSHALARLRGALGDPLFLRRPHGLEPTSRALALAPRLDAILELTGGLLAPPHFDAATAMGVIRIAGADYHCALMAPPIVERLGREAPGLRLAFRPFTRGRAIAALLAGEVDLAVGRFFGLPASVVAHLLFEEGYGVVARPGHPALAGVLDLDAYCAARHVVVSLDGDLEGVVDRALEAIGRRRTVVAAVPYFLAALAVAAETDALVTLPARLARAFAPQFGLATRTPPIALRAFPVTALIPAVVGPGSVAHWLLTDVLQTMAAPP